MKKRNLYIAAPAEFQKELLKYVTKHGLVLSPSLVAGVNEQILQRLRPLMLPDELKKLLLASCDSMKAALEKDPEDQKAEEK